MIKRDTAEHKGRTNFADMLSLVRRFVIHCTVLSRREEEGEGNEKKEDRNHEEEDEERKEDKDHEEESEDRGQKKTKRMKNKTLKKS